MPLFNRPYMKDAPDGGGGFSLGLPRPTRAVTYLLIINAAVFLLQQILPGLSGLFGATVADFWQVWRYITFQFLHTGFMHLLLNMMGLYFFGMALEGLWGTRKFVAFYLTCGAVAGLAYVIIAYLFHQPRGVPLIGASGGVYGIILATAVLLPGMRIIFFIFPMPIRVAAIIIFGVMIFTVLGGINDARAGNTRAMGQAMSDVAHLGGAVTAAVWLWGGALLPALRLGGRRSSSRAGNWQRKIDSRNRHQAEIDKILQKIHDRGINSLSRGERKTLQDASRRQAEEDKKISRM